MPRATRDGVSIYYEFDERPMDERRTATPVVFLQDLGYGRWMWRWQREAVAREFGAPVIAPDLRGTGRSDAGLPPLVSRLPGRLRTPLLQNVASYSVSGLAADLEAVLDDAGVHSAHLVGSGLGGMIAQQYAIDHDRAASLTLCGTTHGGADADPIPDEIPSRLLAASAGGSERHRLREQLRPVFTPAFTNRNPHLIEQLLEWRLEQDASRPALEAQLGAFLGFDSSADLDRIDVPTLLVHGTNDEVVPWLNARLLEEGIPDTRLEVIEGGPHLLGVERADEVTDALLSFLGTQAAVEDGTTGTASERSQTRVDTHA